MRNNNLFDLKNIIKENKSKILSISIITLLSALLLISAINMLQFPKPDANNKNSESSSDRKDNKENSDIREKNSGQEYVERGDRDFRADQYPFNKAQPTPGAPMDKFMEERIRKRLPDYSIDLSKDRRLPPAFSEGSGSSNTIRSGEKPPHTPVLEILGSTDVHVLKVLAMDNYSGNAWHLPPGAKYDTYNGGSTPNPNMKSAKIKPINPSKGFIPVLSNTKAVKFPVSGVVKFAGLDIFYTETNISDYYEVFYQ